FCDEGRGNYSGDDDDDGDACNVLETTVRRCILAQSFINLVAGRCRAIRSSRSNSREINQQLEFQSQDQQKARDSRLPTRPTIRDRVRIRVRVRVRIPRVYGSSPQLSVDAFASNATSALSLFIARTFSRSFSGSFWPSLVLAWSDPSITHKPPTNR
ncbi:uncharacterized protein LOC26514938, partial [Drosophila ananassae]|uniref:uncharacterized protein LOC26514938 n=1 Tax=Drosophila ananassae TaxID=7217 RepID=UPI001CFFA237